MLNNQFDISSTSNRYCLLFITLWVVSMAGVAQDRPLQLELLTDQPVNQEDSVEQVRSLMKMYLLEPDKEIIHRIRDVVSRSGLNEMTESAREHLVKANIYLEKQRYADSIEEYQQVIADSPWIFDAFFNLAHIYAAASQYRKASETMQNYIILQPQGSRSRQAKDSVYRWEVTRTSLGKVRFEDMGVSVSDIDAGNSHLYPGLTGGVIISEIVEGSHAWRSGLKKGDIVSEVNREPVNDIQQFFDMAGSQSGSVQLFINRTRYSVLTPIKVEKSLLSKISYVEIHTTNGGKRVYTTVYGRTNNIDGVLINEIDQDSLAWISGLRKGDVIFGTTKSLLSIFDKKIRNTQEFVSAVNRYKKSFRVFVWRPKHEEIYLVLD
jgi:hypothetical protein